MPRPVKMQEGLLSAQKLRIPSGKGKRTSICNRIVGR